MRESHVVVVGLVRDLERSITKEVNRLNQIFKCFGKVSWFLVESDSSDSTVLELDRLSAKLPEFSFVTLGDIQSKFPDRVERLAFCRDRYMQELTESHKYQDASWVAVVDMDNATPLITRTNLASVLLSDEADAYSSNQSGPYYDIFALRAKGWVDEDPFVTYHSLVKNGFLPDTALEIAVTSRMVRIPEKSSPIPVQSAFGGFTIYKANFFIGCKYSGAKNFTPSTCEHVHANQQFSERGGRLVIHPRLITAKFNRHTRYLRPARKIIQPAISSLRRLLEARLGTEVTTKLGAWMHSTTGL